MYKHAALGGFLFFAAIILFQFCFYIVPEGQQGVVLQFGRVIPPAKKDAGWYLKLPWQNIKMLEKRILNWDGVPNQIPTKDKKYIIVDTTARWRIEDPIKFIQNLVTMEGGRSKIKNWIDSATRDIISSHNLVEAVRNTNDIIKQQKQLKQQRRELEAKSSGDSGDNALQIEIELAEEEYSGELLRVYEGRENLSEKIINIARPEMEANGLALIDVQLRRIAYEESVEQKVYNRMKSERERIAAKLRSIGEGEQAKIRGKKQKELQQIKSEAYEQVQKIKGDAESDAIRIYAEAVGNDLEFYEFLRTVELYQDGIRDDTQFILSAEADFLKFLKEWPVRRRGAQK